MYEARSEHSHTISSATSSGRPARKSRLELEATSEPVTPEPIDMGVAIRPGSTALIRMPRSGNWPADARVNPNTPNLLATYVNNAGGGSSVEPDEIPTMDPPFSFSS